jgi:hypothetical protein
MTGEIQEKNPEEKCLPGFITQRRGKIKKAVKV